MTKKPQIFIDGKRVEVVPQCPKCEGSMETGRGGAELQYYWAGCDPCGIYLSARTEQELVERIKQIREYWNNLRR